MRWGPDQSVSDCLEGARRPVQAPVTINRAVNWADDRHSNGVHTRII